MGRDESAATSPNPCFLLPRSHSHFGSHPLPHRRKNYPFVFIHLRGTHFTTLLFSNSCMEWGGVPPRGLECLSPAPYVLNDHRYGRASLLPTSLPLYFLTSL